MQHGTPPGRVREAAYKDKDSLLPSNLKFYTILIYLNIC
jgi:hypothetical protein